MQFKYVYGPQFGTSNPASIDIRTGVIYVNTCVWWAYSNFEQRVILEHEKFHYISKNTTNEEQCDEHAFKVVAGTEPRSLMQFIDCITAIAGQDEKRIQAAQKLALEYAAKNGSEQAKKYI